MEKLIVLRTVGRAGSVFLHNLFDGHSQIITIPIPFPYYLAWQTFHSRLRRPALADLVTFFLQGTDLRFIFHGNQNWSHELLVDAGDQPRTQVDQKIFTRHLLEHLGDKDYPTRAQFLVALHHAYGKTRGLSALAARTIFLHEHNSYGMEQPHEDFASVANLVMIRDPRNCYASVLKWAVDTHPYSTVFHLHRNIVFEFVGQVNCLGFADRHPGRLRFQRTEDLNREPEPQMRALADWLGLPFEKTLLEATFADCRVKGFSVFKPNQIGFDLPSAETRRWEALCSPSETSLLETIFEPVLARFGYPYRKRSTIEFLAASLAPDRRLLFTRYRRGLARMLAIPTLALLRTKASFLMAFLRLRSGTYPLKVTVLERWAILARWKWLSRRDLPIFARDATT